MKTRIFLPDTASTLLLGNDLAATVRKGDIIAIYGALGAGKTTLSQGFIQALAQVAITDITSPSYTLLNQYESALGTLNHFDLYRLEDETSEETLEEIGFLDALDNADEGSVSLIEWPQRAQSYLPERTLHVQFESGGEDNPDGRTIWLSGDSNWMVRIGRSLQIRQFLRDNGHGKAHRMPLARDGSYRRYELIEEPGKDAVLLMNAPTPRGEPILRDGYRYSDIAHISSSVRVFAALSCSLREKGFPAPEIYAQDAQARLMLTQYFGHETIAKNDKPVPERYEVAVDMLANLHESTMPDMAPSYDGGANTYLSHFDRAAFLIELELLPTWYSKHVSKQPFTQNAKDEYWRIWNALFKQLEQAESSWLLRDYHSPNILWQSDKTGYDRLGIIDFQDAMIGPSAYDVASLAQDARLDISPDLENALKQRYITRRREIGKGGFNDAEFHQAYAICAAQRNTKLLGLWPRLKYRDDKHSYMKHMPRTKEYLARTLSHPVLKDLADWYAAHLDIECTQYQPDGA